MSGKKENNLQAELVNKISVAIVCGNIKAIVKPMKEGEAKPIIRVIGVANGIQTGESDFGSWMAFKGEFKATNLITNKIFVSGKCFLPPVISNLVAGQFTDEVKTVQFAFDIIVVEDQTSQVGYHYTAAPLIQPTENNLLAMIESKIGQ